MTTDRGFKDLVRARMVETGENYTTARATLLADREAAERFAAKTLRTFVHEGRLTAIPVKRRARVIVLLELLHLFQPDREYTEVEVNATLRPVHDDVALLRRELVDYGFMTRAAGVYRVAECFPDHGHTVAPEIPSDAERRFRAATGGTSADRS